MSAARLVKSAIKIPKRIERGPTDILKALSSTVKYLPSEPEPMIMDDPYLIPSRPGHRRLFLLSKLSGIKTAKYLLNKHPELFNRDDAEPKIEAFLPKEQYDQAMEFSEEDLIWCIDNKDPENAVIAYKSMMEKDIKISDEVLLDFFEMICYTNEESILDDVDREKNKFVSDLGNDLINCTWKTSGLASKIFNQIKVDLDPTRVYSAMIAGLVKYNEHATAAQLFEDFKQSNPDKGLYIEAYDSLLKSVPRLNSSIDTARIAFKEIVKSMEQNHIKPDLRTFNTILSGLTNFNCDEETCLEAFKLVNDMYKLNIDPSLATYEAIVIIICRYRRGRAHGELVKEILQTVLHKTGDLEIRDERDIFFLAKTMYFVSSNLNSLPLANMLHRIYLSNSNLFPNNRIRSKYLNSYFKLMVTTDTLDNSLRFYNDNVPYNFIPDADSYEALAEALDIFSAPDEVIEKIGQDIIDAKLTNLIKNDAIFRKNKKYADAVIEGNFK